MHKQRDGFKKQRFQKMEWSLHKREVVLKEELFMVRERDNNPFTLNMYNGGTMKIIFDSIEVVENKAKATGKPFKMTHVKGKALGGKLDGQDYTSKFFTNNKELTAQAEALKKGEIVDIKMEKNGQYFNPVSYTSEGMAPVTGAAGGAGGVTMVENPRLTNLKIAIDIMGSINTGQEPFDYIQEAAGVADLIQHYVDETGAFQFANTTDDIPGVEEEDE